MKFIFVLLSATLLFATAQADSFKKKAVGCVSEELYDEITTAAARQDLTHFSYLLKNGCVLVRQGIRVSILDTTWTGRAKVRAYSEEMSAILWTNIANIERDR
jgi:hypothetical protein